MALLPPLHRLVVMSYGWFRNLPEDVQTDMLRRAQRRRLAGGERLYARGDESDGMYGVVEGAVRVSGMAPDGREIVLDFFGPGIWFGEVAALDDFPRNHSVDAYEATELWQLMPGDLEDLLATNPRLSRSLLRLEAQRLRILATALEAYSTQALEQRLANRLLMLAGQYGVPSANGVKIELHLPQETLAQLIGATRQRVNQILKEWEAAGLVQQRYGQTFLMDPGRLERITET